MGTTRFSDARSVMPGPLKLLAPLAGWLGPLDEAPDAVFATRLMGDGVAIDPTGTRLHAPCDGVVIGVHRTRHAVTLRADNGAELLLHVGIDTVGLAGVGFTAQAVDGQRVAAGDVLLTFDLDILAGAATSLLTPIVVTNGDDFAVTSRAGAGAVEVGDWMMDVEATTMGTIFREAVGGTAISHRVAVAAAHGLHARPAAAIARTAKQFAAEVELVHGDRRANAGSTVAIMALGLAFGDEVLVTATGADKTAAVAAVAALIAADPGDPPPSAAVAPARSMRAGLLHGVGAAPGLAIGVAVRLDGVILTPAAEGRGAAIEAAALADAVAAVRHRLTAHAARGSRQQAAIVAAHLELLDDPEIGAAAHAAIDGGRSAGAAWSAALAPQIARLRAVGDARIASRADDLLDLEQQVVAATLGIDGAATVLPEDAILLADDLLPSQLMTLDATRIAGIATAGGGPTSHVAIIAAAMNIPAVVALGSGILTIAPGRALLLDSTAATLDIDPSAEALADARHRIAAGTRRRQSARAAAADDCHMADGTRIEVFANLGSLADAAAAVAAGAEGCGLLRTELLFLDRRIAPDEAEQAGHYQAIADTLAGRPLIVRTLDIGGDKPVAYLDLPAEDNPALGLRGIRVGLSRPDLLREQLSAILRVRPVGRCRILVPMVASVSEVIAVRAMLDALAAEAGIVERVALGVMIETPAAAMTADLLAAHADFFAIGTNDLAQYTLAMDRGNPLVAASIDALHPAVLRLVARAVSGAAAHGRPVGVCGGLASDLIAAPILIGLGVTELSAVPAIVPELKALVRTLTAARCAGLAEAALRQTSAAAVRALTGATR